MQPKLSVTLLLVLAMSAPASPNGLDARQHSSASRPQEVSVAIPESLRTEHAAIHAALVEATKAPGRVGEAARELAEVLHPHFEREEQIALPPLGLLAPLAAGARPPGMAEVLAMTDALGREMPRMLDEHQRIHAAVEKLREAAREARLQKHEEFAGALALHAQTEEQVLYPAALLVGEVVRARLQSK
jgi:hypothetical protein